MRYTVCLRKMSPVITGKDWAIVMLEFEKIIVGFWDIGRFNVPNYQSPLYTFGKFIFEVADA